MNTRFTFFLPVGLLACGDATAPTGEFLAVTEAIDQPPLANAGPDSEVLRGFPATLRGESSYHPTSRNFAARWEQLEGESVTLSNPESLRPTFVAPVREQSLVFSLTVDDGDFFTIDRVTLKVVREPSGVAPRIRTGPDRFVASGQLLEPGSDDILTDDVNGLWERVVVSASPSSRARTDYSGPAVFRATALRDGLSSAPDYLFLFPLEPGDTNQEALARQAPVASLDGPTVVDPGVPFTLDASDTVDPNGDSIRFRWEQTRGEPVLSPGDAGTGVRTVTAPDAPQALVFRAFGSDDRLESAATERTVLVRTPEGSTQLDLGPGVDLRSRPGREVTLDPRRVTATQLPGDVYEWVQTRGPEVALNVKDNGSVSFAADDTQTLAFALGVRETSIVSSPTVSTVTVVGPDENQRPVVFLCSSLEQPEAGQIVTLAARVFDPEGDALTEPVWTPSQPLEFLNDAANAQVQTCAGDPPTQHGGPVESAAVTSVSFEMPETDIALEFHFEACDSEDACTEGRVRFTRD